MSTVPQKLGNYELRHVLSRDNIGESWRGYDTQKNRDAIVKILHTDLQSDPNFLNRFTTNGQKVVALHHDNIASVYDVAIVQDERTKGTTAYIASAYITDQTLEKYIAGTSQKGMLLSQQNLVYLFTSIGVAVDYAHQSGVVHGNIKPGNILLDQEHTTYFTHGEPELSNFGLPLLLGNTINTGSPAYMSPEQARGDAPNNRSDIYALGVILYELCTGVKPFRNESSVAVIMQHINTLPTPPSLVNPQVPQALSEVILRALAKDPSTRYSMASLFATSIADACAIRPTIALQHKTIAEDASEYQSTSGQYGSFLGVSQPANLIQFEQRAQTSPMEPIKPKAPTTPFPLSQPASPLPAAWTTKLPGTDNSGKMPVVSPKAVPITRKIPTPLPPSVVPSMPSQPTLLAASAERTTKTGQTPIVTQAFMPPVPTAPSQGTPTLPGLPKRSTRNTNLPLYAILAVVVLLILIVGGIFGVLLLNTKNADTAIVGHAFFQDDAMGYADELRLTISNVPTPDQGKVYQAWLQESDNHAVLLGPLSLANGTATLLYQGNAQHTNLLSQVQGLIVTTEDAGKNPVAPGGDVVYRATLNAAAFQYIQRILYKTPNFPANTSVVVGMFQTIMSINDKAGSLVDSLQGTHDYALAKRQAVRILELIDGSKYARTSGDLPQNIQSEVDAQVGLISSPSQQGYIDTLSDQLDDLQKAEPNNTELQQHITNVRNAITDLREWVQGMRTYDRSLVQTTNIAKPTLLNDALQVRQLANYVYTGRVAPPNESPGTALGSAGVYQAYTECQYLATLDIKKVG